MTQSKHALRSTGGMRSTAFRLCLCTTCQALAAQLADRRSLEPFASAYTS